MISSREALELYRALTRTWIASEPTDIPQARPQPVRDLLEGLHGCNFYSWKADDRSRGDLPPETIVGYKRALDASNLMRNHFMEEIDSAAVAAFDLGIDQDCAGRDLNSETLGQMLDRLSVLTLKSEFAALRMPSDSRSQSLARIGRQIRYVAQCHDVFLGKLESGTGYMLAYKQYKMYKPD